MADPGRIKRVFPVFIILFLVPILIILLFRYGKNVYKPLPYLGNYEGIDTKGDTIRHSIPAFLYTDQYGRSYGSDSLKGKIYVADFFFTSCPNICPTLTKNLKTVQEKFRDDQEFRIVSFSLDPKRDTVAALKRYAEKYKISTYQWHFLTAPKEDILKIIGEKGYLIARPIEGAEPNQMLHSKFIVLVDKEGHIRGSYDGTNEDDIQRLVEDAHTLFVYYAKHTNK
jgi:protein SCO1